MSAPRCRLCGEALRTTVIDLGEQPLANRYLQPHEVPDERRYPLHARLCENCGLVQVDDVVPAAEIFEDYAYFSSFSESWLSHARQFCARAVDRLALDDRGLVVEVASNDGYLLRWFVERGIPVLGVEPAKNVAEAAIELGVPTISRFFGRDLAEEIRSERGAASLIIGNNVLAHVPDLNDFVAGLALLLDPAGSISIEVPHLLNLVRQTQFDTIYHEHYSYFSLIAASAAFERHGLTVVDVERLPTHGGSLRLWVRHGGEVSAKVHTVLTEEVGAALDRPAGYRTFAESAKRCREALRAYVLQSHEAGRSIVAYGAAAKGNTLLNFAQIRPEHIPYVVDRSPYKQGFLLPGSHLPVREPEAVFLDRPDELLILPWNLTAEISEQMKQIREWGGRFLTAVPALRSF